MQVGRLLDPPDHVPGRSLVDGDGSGPTPGVIEIIGEGPSPVSPTDSGYVFPQVTNDRGSKGVEYGVSICGVRVGQRVRFFGLGEGTYERGWGRVQV